jgi:hypothetical protein
LNDLRKIMSPDLYPSNVLWQGTQTFITYQIPACHKTKSTKWIQPGTIEFGCAGRPERLPVFRVFLNKSRLLSVWQAYHGLPWQSIFRCLMFLRLGLKSGRNIGSMTDIKCSQGQCYG